MRFGANPWTWPNEVQIFKPCRDLAYGHFMHWSGLDDINRRVPPDFGDDLPGWAYGLFFLRRFTSWDPSSRELSLAYLMSTNRPYQVQVMRSNCGCQLCNRQYAGRRRSSNRTRNRCIEL